MELREFVDAEDFLKALGEETRLKIVAYLTMDCFCVCELVGLLQMSQPAVSQHLKRLKQSDIINEERRGRWIYYSLNKENKRYPLILHFVSTLPYLTININRNMCE
ncbi:winged helix-turn-helix transcriptional regulator [Bacillus aquiflavi]|uniref:Winged helix-turn-helix transcriptional regulator n=1 Tax=Bacillus aquiflavi TaxID=2672567 RepID=A0A6B3W1H4_9BACI|nr:winged helix-turn-helix transcriptional regulator [Bacillus aquiflavi]NEY83082.1 winged helix-turn-helix transcriptional regulator [Bacillus aquiflavi]